MYILTVIKNILGVLDRQTTKYYIALQLFFLLAAFFQVVGIASIGPFITVLLNPDMIHTNSVLAYVYEIGGFTSEMQFIFATEFGSLVQYLLSFTFAIISTQFSISHTLCLAAL